MIALRLGAAALLLLAAGCDSLVEDGYDGVIEVSITDASGALSLRLVAIEDTGCDRQLVLDADPEADRLEVEVRGLGPENPCDAVIPASATVSLEGVTAATFPVEIEHAGSTDRYRLDRSGASATLEAVETSTTRLGAGTLGPE